jgi:putative oxidoreductase
VQRFFSTFPNERPGAGLLLLRLTLSAGLLVDGFARIHEPAIAQILLAIGEFLIGPLLIAGMWTPIVGVVVCVLQLSIVVMTDGTLELPLQRAAIGLGLALLGPGAWSVDARVFGRRRIAIKDLREP